MYLYSIYLYFIYLYPTYFYLSIYLPPKISKLHSESSKRISYSTWRIYFICSLLSIFFPFFSLLLLLSRQLFGRCTFLVCGCCCFFSARHRHQLHLQLIFYFFCLLFSPFPYQYLFNNNKNNNSSKRDERGRGEERKNEWGGTGNDKHQSRVQDLSHSSWCDHAWCEMNKI